MSVSVDLQISYDTFAKIEICGRFSASVLPQYWIIEVISTTFASQACMLLFNIMAIVIVKYLSCTSLLYLSYPHFSVFLLLYK